MRSHIDAQDGCDDPFAIVGYNDRLSVVQGQSLHTMVHSTERYSASLLRLDVDDGLADIGEELGRFPATPQCTQTGSYVEVADSDAFDTGEALTIAAWIYPTTPTRHEQGLLTKACAGTPGGWSLSLNDEGQLVFEIAASAEVPDRLIAEQPLSIRWHFVIASFDGVARIQRLASLTPRRRWGEDIFDCVERATAIQRIGSTNVPLLIGAKHTREQGKLQKTGFYNGKVDTPTVLRIAVSLTRDFVIAAASNQLQAGDAALVAQWDFSRDQASDHVRDLSPARLDGCAFNSPARAVTGWRWDGRNHSFTEAPTHYTAMHFHEDDLDDARWHSPITYTVPDDLPSGVYAIQVASDTASDRIPFFVVPRRASQRKTVAFIAPTFTYLAYGNDRLWSRTDIPPGLLWPVERAERPAPVDRYLAAHPEVGRSLYDEHVDGSGVAYASFLRPLVNLRDDYRYWQTDAPRHFSADLLLLRWLQRRRIEYDVLTDHDLNEDPSLLDDYWVLLTGSHPEYATSAILDGLASFLDRGGRIMYLGGNGFYWVTTVAPDRAHVIEVRRGNAGSRNWTSAPGEAFHSTTGELGGLWRHRGRPPQELVAVGFAAMGSLHGAGYTRTLESYDADVSFIFKGVHEPVIGDYGRALDGAAGDEIDRVDFALGTPAKTRLLATSSLRHDSSFYRCIEDVMQLAPGYDGPSDDAVRADMAYLAYDTGGAVYSAGSMNWILSLDHNGDDNDVSRITENVLRAFISTV